MLGPGLGEHAACVKGVGEFERLLKNSLLSVEESEKISLNSVAYLLHALANILMSISYYEEAISLLNASIEINELFAPAYGTLAIALHRNQNTLKAQDILLLFEKKFSTRTHPAFVAAKKIIEASSFGEAKSSNLS